MFLNIFDESFNRLGVIDVYEDLDFTANYYNHSMLVATIDASQKNIKHFVNSNELRILTKSTDLRRGYVVDYADFKDGTKTELVIIAKSLSIMLNWRMIERQQVFKGNIVNVMYKFVEPFTISSSKLNRILPNLVIGSSEFIDITIEAAYTDKPLDESLWDICMKNEVSFEILMNHETKKYEFVVYEGENRSTLQEVNSHVIFAAVFGNVISQSYLDDKSNYKSTAYVAGEGEGGSRKVLILNDEASGFARREVFFDARDLQSTYTNSNDVEVTIPPTEYEALLRERGLNRLADYPHIQTFINDTDATSQYIYGRDYFLGDVTTSRNDKLSLITHSRVVVAKENYNKSGYLLKVEFGVAIPTIFEKIKKEINNVNGGSNGSSGTSGSDGVGLEYTISEASIGIKREDETEYTYLNVKGDPGEIGPPGIPGERGEPGRDGKQGPIGITGSPGNDGYTPIKGVDYFDGAKGAAGNTGSPGRDGEPGVPGKQGLQGEIGLQGLTGLTGAKGEIGPQGNTGLKGDKGDKGDTGLRGIQGLIGNNGISVTHSWSGTSLSVTSASGTTSANLKGETGANGEQGIQGIQGIQGTKGNPFIYSDFTQAQLNLLKGAKGDTGSTGSKGDTGETGLRGIQGLQGIQGTIGLTGPKGDKGDTGIQGIPGPAVADSVEWIKVMNKPSTFPATAHSHTKAQVGLGNVDNTTDLAKPISTATQTALNTKANIASPTFTGSPKAPTAPTGTGTTQLATTAFVQNAVAISGDNTFVHEGKSYKYALKLNVGGDGLVFGYEEI